MDDRELDRAYEKETDRMLAAMETDSAWDRCLEAVACLREAEKYYDRMLDSLLDAANEVIGLPAEDYITSITSEFEDLAYDLRKLTKDLINGEHRGGDYE